MSLEELKDKLKRIENEENSGRDKKGRNVRFLLYVNIPKVASDESDKGVRLSDAEQNHFVSEAIDEAVDVLRKENKNGPLYIMDIQRYISKTFPNVTKAEKDQNEDVLFSRHDIPPECKTTLEKRLNLPQSEEKDPE